MNGTFTQRTTVSNPSIDSYTPASTPHSSPRQLPQTIMNESKQVTDAEVSKVDEISTIATSTTATNGDAVATGASIDVKDKNKDKSKGKDTKKKKKKTPKGSCKTKQKHSKLVEASKKEVDSSDSSSTSDSDSSTSDSSCDSSSDSSSSSEDESAKRKKKSKKNKAKKKEKKEKEKAKKKTKSKSRKVKVQSSSDESDSDADSESEEKARPKKKKTKKTKAARESSAARENDANEESATKDTGNTALQQIIAALSSLNVATGGAATTSQEDPSEDEDVGTESQRRSRRRRARARGRTGGNRGTHGIDLPSEDKPADGKAAYKRVDQIWDTNIHDYRLQETAKEQIDTFDDYVFHVRRQFDWENKFRNTTVDIKSKQLQLVLQEIMKGVRAVSLVEGEPSIDPNMLFLYLEEMRAFYKTTLKERIKAEKKKKLKKRLRLQREHLKVMVAYLDKDYDSTKKTLEPMLKAGNITFELLWALFKPNSIAFTTTYGASDQPRCFKVDQAYKEKSFTRGEYYLVEGRYLEYDGKSFGLGDFQMTIDAFKGPRKITQLSTYPLSYHRNAAELRKSLVDRGKKFVTLAGMNFKHMKGLAFMKKKKQILKFNINGRVMIDPKTFRRENANYQVSTLIPPDDLEETSDEEDCSCGSDDDDDEAIHSSAGSDAGASGGAKFKIVFDQDDKPHYVEIGSDDEADAEVDADVEAEGERLFDSKPEEIERLDDSLDKKRDFSEEELLIASSVVLGFSFVEKNWFEFSVNGIDEIAWDDGAFDSLVLDPSHKAIVKAQVCSHKFHSGKTIDDIIQGKGKGLVFVLHGPPGVGKTLTAEGVAEFLRSPLYAVSAGDLGTDARIEAELTKIMSIAHGWGAVLLLDEADVFLEKRQHQDVHRNALVSVFLRLLEYFQGILFLTTNRVETFDEAFQSRIHIALKYAELGVKAKREIWKMFLGRVEQSGSEISTFSDANYDLLAKSNLNGRQVRLTFFLCSQAFIY